jgi:erythronate-4-phosphate dehydrogenase
MNKLVDFMKIIADENIPYVKEFFSSFGDVIPLPGRQLTQAQLGDAEILLVRSVTQVNKTLLEGSKIRFVGTCTIGIDHLDTEYLRANNIAYASAPGCNAGGVVQYVLNAVALLQPDWQTKSFGIVGCGNVGGRLCRALVALGVSCVAYDPMLRTRENMPLASLDEVLACDVVCMHTPLTKTGLFPTFHMLNSVRLQQLKKGAILLNAGRGGAIDNHALLEHLNAGADLRVILDVWENEPEISLNLMDKVNLATPHIAGYSFEGKLKGSAMIQVALAKYLEMDEQNAKVISEKLVEQLSGKPLAIQAENVNQALVATCDLLADDQRTRQALKAAPAGLRGKAFDDLRKFYPERREFSHFAINAESSLGSQLSQLGFGTIAYY